MFLAAIGIFGVTAYVVSQSTHDIGIRRALGARRRKILSLVLRQTILLSLIGIVAGLVGAVAVTRYLETMLFHVSPLDPATFLVMSLLFILVASAVAFIPARHATHVDPLVALRHN